MTTLPMIVRIITKDHENKNYKDYKSKISGYKLCLILTSLTSLATHTIINDELTKTLTANNINFVALEKSIDELNKFSVQNFDTVVFELTNDVEQIITKMFEQINNISKRSQDKITHNYDSQTYSCDSHKIIFVSNDKKITKDIVNMINNDKQIKTKCIDHYIDHIINQYIVCINF